MSTAALSGPTSADLADTGPGPLSGPGPVGVGGTGDAATARHRAAGHEERDGGLIRHEERLHVSTIRVPVRRVRYTRRVITETRMIPVEVRREVLDVDEVALPERPFPDESVGSSPAAELVIVLREEIPVISLEIRATETVRISVHSVASTIDVTEELSREQVAVDQSATGR